MGTSCGKVEEKKRSRLTVIPSFHRSETGHLVPITSSLFLRGEQYFTKKGDEAERIMGPLQVEGSVQSIELFVSLTNYSSRLSREYKVKVALKVSKNSQVLNFLGETEGLNGRVMNFGVTFVFDYFFEKEQVLRISILHREDVIAFEELRVAHIIGIKGSSLSLPITNYINDEEKHKLKLSLRCRNAIKIITECFLEISVMILSEEYSLFNDLFLVINNINDGYNWRSVYKSREYSGKPNEEITLDKIILKPYDLSRDPKENVLIAIYINNQSKSLGETLLSLDSLRNGEETFPVKNGSKNIGDLKVVYTEKPLYKFIDFLNIGLKINLAIGIDFTSSNGNPSDVHSLHYVNGKEQTQYEKAIVSCVNIVGYYDTDQLFPVYGFGAELPFEKSVNNCFALNFKEDANIKGVDNILRYYRNALTFIELSGPTCFVPLLQKIKHTIEEDKELIYYILMILTDGNICDVKETSNLLVECALYPLSVIIIGIGNTEFNTMVKLDGDEEPLMNSNGQVTKRDMVQFVPYNKCDGDPNRVAELVLQEIPKQIEEYFRLTNNYEKIGLKS